MQKYSRFLIEIICLAIFSMSLVHGAIFVRTGIERAEQFSKVEVVANQATQTGVFQFDDADNQDENLVKLNLANHLESDHPKAIGITSCIQVKQKPNDLYRLHKFQNSYIPLTKPPKINT